MSCTLCDEPSTAGELVFENEAGRVLLHPDSAVAGHAMVVARRHVENYSDLSRDELHGFASLQHAAERALLEVTRADRSIVLKLGIQTPHLHIHVYPVSNRMTRAEVMKVLDAEVREMRPHGFADAVRKRIERLTASA